MRCRREICNKIRELAIHPKRGGGSYREIAEKY